MKLTVVVWSFLVLITFSFGVLAKEKKFLTKEEIKNYFLGNIQDERDKTNILSSEDVERASNILSYDEMVSPTDKENLKKWWNENKNKKDKIKKDRAIKDTVDLRYRDTPIKKQFGGTCTTFAMVATMENLINKPKVAHLSERHLWSKYEEPYVSSAFKAATSYKITEEKYWPEKNTNPYVGYKDHAHTKLIRYNSTYGDIEDTLIGMNKGYPAYIAMRVTDDMYRCRAVIKGDSKIIEGAGHAIAIVGYALDEAVDGGGYFILKNSWSTDCGDNGYQYLSFQQCLREDIGCMLYLIKEVETDF